VRHCSRRVDDQRSRTVARVIRRTASRRLQQLPRPSPVIVVVDVAAVRDNGYLDTGHTQLGHVTSSVTYPGWQPNSSVPFLLLLHSHCEWSRMRKGKGTDELGWHHGYIRIISHLSAVNPVCGLTSSIRSLACPRKSRPEKKHTSNLLQFEIKQGVALTGRNRTGPPCSVGRPTVHAPGRRPVRPPVALQTTLTECKTILTHKAGQ